MRIISTLGVTWLLALAPSAAISGSIQMCNESTQLIRVASGVNGFMGPRSWGWYYIDIGECDIVARRFNGGYISFRVETVRESSSGEMRLPYNADGNTDFVNFCVLMESDFDIHGRMQTECQGTTQGFQLDEIQFQQFYYDAEIVDLIIR